ncbi:MAG: hypothetical protein GF368_02120 [Candidatus Aenigmarchaeota archaeon]|nr:hypothetical protein [Candidatus Aenigmarchaeota archaeon]
MIEISKSGKKVDPGRPRVNLNLGPHPVTIPAENVGPYLRRHGYTMEND